MPFLVFAIGVSTAQKLNGIMQDVRSRVAAHTPSAILAGLTALLADAVSFAVLMMIDIGHSRTCLDGEHWGC